MRSYLSTHWLWAARHFEEQAKRIELMNAAETGFDLLHRAMVLAAITASVSFLEAAVNELFEDATDGHGVTGDGYLAALAPTTIAAMATEWRRTGHGRDNSVRDKYELLLTTSSTSALDLGARPAQDLTLLVILRNTLVHYLPDDTAADVVHHLERKLRGRFETNRLMLGSGNGWWPDHCLGAGCAGWAVQSAEAFADAAFGQVGIVPNYARHRGTPWFEGPENPAA